MVARRIAVTFATLLALAALLGLVRRDRLRRRRERLATVPPPASSEEESYSTLRSLDEAHGMEHTAVVMQGKGGEQIYLTVPVKDVACDERTLRTLLLAIDGLALAEPESATLSFELAPVGSGFYGGMGGGAIVDGVWMHETLEEFLPVASSVIDGRKSFDEVRTEFRRRLR